MNLSNIEIKSLLNSSVLNTQQAKTCKKPDYLKFLSLNNFNTRVTLGTLRDELNLFNGADIWGPKRLYKLTEKEFNFILKKAKYFN